MILRFFFSGNKISAIYNWKLDLEIESQSDFGRKNMEKHFVKMTEILRRSMSSHFKSFCFKEIVTQLVNPSQSLVRERGLDKQNCSFWPQKSFQWFNISLLKGAADEIIAILSCGLDGAWVSPYMSTKRILLPNKKKIHLNFFWMWTQAKSPGFVLVWY